MSLNYMSTDTSFVGLDARETRFLLEYLATFNGARSVERAGFNVGQSTVVTKSVMANRILARPNVRRALIQSLSEHVMPAKEVLARLSFIATGDINDFLTINQEGVISVDLQKARRYQKTRLIKKLKTTTRTTTDTDGAVTVTQTTELELYDALAALDKLMRHFGLYKDSLALHWRFLTETPEQRELAENLFHKLAKDIAVRMLAEASPDD